MELAHWDGDAFFASVEQAADPRLRGLPVAVGGGPGGVIACASYEARAFGIRAAMPTREALRRCPDLRLLRGHFELYEQFSSTIFDLCRELSPEVEERGLDEGFIGLMGWAGGTRRLDPVAALRSLAKEVNGWLKVTISQGLASNRRVAAIASKWRKPNGFVVVPEGAEAEFLESLPVTELPGIGPQTAAMLAGLGVQTIGAFRQLDQALLRRILGVRAEDLREAAFGRDNRPFLSPSQPQSQSLSRQITFDEETGDEAQILREAKMALEQALRDLRQSRRGARTLTLAITYSDYAEHSGSHSLPSPSAFPEAFFPLFPALLRKTWKRRVLLRRVRIRLSNFYPACFQDDLFERCGESRFLQLNAAMDQLQASFGQQVLRRGYALEPNA